MPGSSPAGGRLAVRLAALAAVTTILVGASSIGRTVGFPLGVTVEPAAAADVACGPYTPLPPAGGVVRAVSNQSELAAAVAAARPGDVINLASGVYSRVDHQLDRGHRSGTASAPIVIQAAAGATPIIDAGDNGNPSRRFAVSIIRSAHVRVRGLEIRNGIFGALSRGSASITFEHNHIHHLGQVGVATGAAETPGGYEPSSDTVIRCNRIHHTGMLDHEFGEGIYVGNGGTDVVDRTSGVLIENNEIHSIANEAIDVKRYTTNVTIRRNLIHDVTPYYGGAISLGLNKNHWGPANYLVEGNAIWNVSSGRHYAQAIAVAHGPTTIRNNTIWAVDTRISDSWPWTATIQIHGNDSSADSAYGFGNPSATRVDVIGNTVIGCNQGCIDSYTDPGQITPTLNVQSNIVDRASTGAAANGTDIIVSAADLVGPVTGTADSGSGPGSGLRLPTNPPPTTAPPPPRPTTTTTRRTTTTATTTRSMIPATDRETSTAPSTTSSTGSTPRPSSGSTPRRSSSSNPPTIPAYRPAPPSSSDTARTGTRQADPVPARGAIPTGTTARGTTGGVVTTTRRKASTSTMRKAGSSTVAPGRRRGSSDLQMFLDVNLGPNVERENEPPAKISLPSPDGPDWLAALTTPSKPVEAARHRTSTTRSEPSEGRRDNATRDDNRLGRTSMRHARLDTGLPSTTRPATTAGMTTTFDEP